MFKPLSVHGSSQVLLALLVQEVGQAVLVNLAMLEVMVLQDHRAVQGSKVSNEI